MFFPRSPLFHHRLCSSSNDNTHWLCKHAKHRESKLPKLWSLIIKKIGFFLIMMLIFDILHHLFDEQCSSDRWNHQLRSNFQANGKSWPTLISCLWDQRKWRYPLRFSLFYSVSPNYLVLMLANKGQRMICTSYRHSFKLHYCFSTYSFFLAGRVSLAG